MAGWMIRLSDYYLDSVHQMMKDELKKAPLIHCDESPFTMSGEKMQMIRRARITCGSIIPPEFRIPKDISV